jgi:hypothetical protein
MCAAFHVTAQAALSKSVCIEEQLVVYVQNQCSLNCHSMNLNVKRSLNNEPYMQRLLCNASQAVYGQLRRLQSSIVPC